jgi:ATP-dependent Clp protease ATP-binding subunit ClpC
MFELFSARAREVLTLAQEESRRVNRHEVGPEHLLLGLISEQKGIAGQVLKTMGAELRSARAEVSTLGDYENELTGSVIPFTNEAQQIFEFALEESRQLGHNCIDTEHLLLGLLRQGEHIPIQLLTNIGIDPDEVRTQVLNPQSDLLSSSPKTSSGTVQIRVAQTNAQFLKVIDQMLNIEMPTEQLIEQMTGLVQDYRKS